MFDKNSIAEKIEKEIRGAIHDIDPSFDIIGTLNLYFELLDYEHNEKTNNEIIKWHLENSEFDDKNLENNKRDDISGLNKNTTKFLTNFFDNQIQDSDVLKYCSSFEIFLKKLYYVLEENDEIAPNISVNPLKPNALMPFMSSINRLFQYDIKNQKKTHPEDKPLELYNNRTIGFGDYLNIKDKNLNEKYSNSLKLYIIQAYILRNLDSHQMPEMTISERAEYFKATTIAKLHILNFVKDKLKNCFKNQNFKNQNFENYLKKQKETFEKQNEKFVSLNFTEWSNKNNLINEDINTILKHDGYNQIRILGNGGAGKTTTLEHLLYNDVINYKKNKSIPVLISLASIPKNKNLLDWVADKIFIDQDKCLELLNNNQIRLYLDGLNEILVNEKSGRIQGIVDILKKYPDLQTIITDRHEIDSIQNDWFDIPTFVIDPLDESKIKEFVNKNCGDNKKLASSVLKILNEKLDIQDIISKPLILTRAIEIIKNQNDLPESEGKIIEKFVDILLEREKNEKKDPILKIRDFKLAVAYFSYEMKINKYLENKPMPMMSAEKIMRNAHEKFGFENPALYTLRIGCELEILIKIDDTIRFFHQSYFDWFYNYYMIYESS